MVLFLIAHSSLIQPPKAAGAAFGSLVSRTRLYIVRAHMRGLVDHFAPCRCVSCTAAATTLVNGNGGILHHVLRINGHDFCFRIFIHFHNSLSNLAAKVRQIFDICKFLPYFLQQIVYFTNLPVASNIFSPRRMKSCPLMIILTGALSI